MKANLERQIKFIEDQEQERLAEEKRLNAVAKGKLTQVERQYQEQQNITKARKICEKEVFHSNEDLKLRARRNKSRGKAIDAMEQRHLNDAAEMEHYSKLEQEDQAKK